jgi:hypothetical protein
MISGYAPQPRKNMNNKIQHPDTETVTIETVIGLIDGAIQATQAYTISEAFVRELLQNLPEYAMNFRCLAFDYEKCEFTLKEEETRDVHLLNVDKAMLGLLAMLQDALENLDKGCGHLLDLTNPGNWDAIMLDALIQYSLLGDVVYE